jgi:hypothetical protein
MEQRLCRAETAAVAFGKTWRFFEKTRPFTICFAGELDEMVGCGVANRQRLGLNMLWKFITGTHAWRGIPICNDETIPAQFASHIRGPGRRSKSAQTASKFASPGECRWTRTRLST